ncbi:Acyltransferase family [[Pasteurella] aerogenes]|nr:Acyltransferase family [[Pasteurella] aerogenes]
MGLINMNEKLNNIQGLRFIAFTLVFFNHSWSLISSGKIFDYGARGVEIFFILSGYLIAYNYSSRINNINNTSWLSCLYYLKSKLKKFYFLHLFTFFIAVYVLGSNFTNNFEYVTNALLTLLMLKSWYQPAMFSFNGATWFISSMLFCWLFVPKIAIFFKDKSNSILFFYFIILFLIKLTIDTLVFRNGVRLPETISLYVFPPYRFIDFLLGYLSFLLFRDFQLRNSSFIKISFLQSIFLIVILFVYIKMNNSFYYSQFLVFDVILIHLVFVRGGVFDYILGNRLFVHLGNISFELYILHGEIIALLKKWLLPLGVGKLTIFLLVIGITMLLSEFFYWRPVRKFITDKIWSLGRP